MRSESEEMYLETILRLEKAECGVQEIEISRAMKVFRPAVSRAMKRMKEKNLVKSDKGKIYLTEQGRQTAELVYERHRVFSRLFQWIGVSEEIAEKDACRCEHFISEDSFATVKDFLKNKEQ